MVAAHITPELYVKDLLYSYRGGHLELLLAKLLLGL